MRLAWLRRVHFDAVQTMRLGRSGLVISRLALGTWRTWGNTLDYEAAERCLRTALEHGVNLVDVADVYAGGQAESWLGWMMESLRRSDVVVSTKFFWPTDADDPNARGLSSKHLTEQLETSLRRLRTDYVDLLFCHRVDPRVPAEETVRTIGRMIDAGKVLYWGVSSADVARIMELSRTAEALGVPRPIASQPRYNLLDRGIEDELLPTCRSLGMGQVVFSPLGQGRIVREGTPAVDALRWCLKQPDVCAIFGASSPEQVLANCAAGAPEP